MISTLPDDWGERDGWIEIDVLDWIGLCNCWSGDAKNVRSRTKATFLLAVFLFIISYVFCWYWYVARILILILVSLFKFGSTRKWLNTDKLQPRRSWDLFQRFFLTQVRFMRSLKPSQRNKSAPNSSTSKVRSRVPKWNLNWIGGWSVYPCWCWLARNNSIKTTTTTTTT